MKTIQDFAALLDGREYKKEMTEDEIIQARELGFVIVFGCSDDRTVFHGAIEEERQTVDGGSQAIAALDPVALTPDIVQQHIKDCHCHRGDPLTQTQGNGKVFKTRGA